MLASSPVNEPALAPAEIGAPTILPPLTKAWNGIFTEGQQRRGNSSTTAFLEAKDPMETLEPPHPTVTSGFVSVVWVFWCCFCLFGNSD